MPNKPPNKPNELMQYAGMATQILVLLGIAIFGGYKLDNYLHSLPLCTVLFPIIALVGIFWQVYNSSKRK